MVWKWDVTVWLVKYANDEIIDRKTKTSEGESSTEDAANNDADQAIDEIEQVAETNGWISDGSSKWVYEESEIDDEIKQHVKKLFDTVSGYQQKNKGKILFSLEKRVHCIGREGLCKLPPYYNIQEQRWRNRNNYPIQGVWEWYYASGTVGGEVTKDFKKHQTQIVKFPQYTHKTVLIDIIK